MKTLSKAEKLSFAPQKLGKNLEKTWRRFEGGSEKSWRLVHYINRDVPLTLFNALAPA
jgi:hypothetical protein